jgi:EmrB/QacA subfamily drug resistance transporter
MSAPELSTGKSESDRALILVALVAVLGSIMTILDSTIVNVAVDTISRAFNAPLPTIQWTTGGYLLALAVVIPLTGWASGKFGTKRLYQFSMAVFLAGSVLCGAAWSVPSLIVFRVLQGLGGGLILPVAMTMLTQAAGPNRTARAMSVAGAPLLLGPILGPALGGWLITISWRWIFFINLPIGVAAMLLAFVALPRDEPGPADPLDRTGLVLLPAGIGLLAFGLGHAASTGLAAASSLIPTLAGAALIAAFVAHALRAPHPLIDVRLFARRAVAAAGATQFLFATAFFGSMLLIPLYFQVVRGESALGAGLLLTPYGVGAVITMAVAGRIADRSGPRGIIFTGLAFLALGLLILTQVGPATSYWLLGAAQFLLGLGMGATLLPGMSAAYQAARAEEIAQVTATINIVVRLGGAFGVALLAIVLTWRLPAGGRPSATAFAHTFWWAEFLILAAALAATLMPRAKA